MDGLEKTLFDASREALEKYNDAKTAYIIAEREMWKALEAQKAYYNAETATKEIYCGNEETASFLIDALEQLNIKVKSEIFTIDGEYYVEIKN